MAFQGRSCIGNVMMLLWVDMDIEKSHRFFFILQNIHCWIRACPNNCTFSHNSLTQSFQTSKAFCCLNDSTDKFFQFFFFPIIIKQPSFASTRQTESSKQGINLAARRKRSSVDEPNQATDTQAAPNNRHQPHP